MIDRIHKINSLIRDELNKLILQEVEFPPDALVTITGVHTAKDLHYAKIYISVLPQNHAEEVLKILKKSHLQNLLFRKLSIPFVLKLQYAIDNTEANAQDIENLLDQVQKKM